jgi:transposase-like protein
MGEKKRRYPAEVKREVLRLKWEEGWSNRALMDTFGIKNVSQIKQWAKWVQNGEEHRLDQPIGRPNIYGASPQDSETDRLRKLVQYYEMKESLRGKYQELERRWTPKSSSRSSTSTGKRIR